MQYTLPFASISLAGKCVLSGPDSAASRSLRSLARRSRGGPLIVALFTAMALGSAQAPTKPRPDGRAAASSGPPAWFRLFADQLDHSDPMIARGARAGLLMTNREDRGYLRSIAEGTDTGKSAVAKEILADFDLLIGSSWTSIKGWNSRVGMSMVSLDLSAEQAIAVWRVHHERRAQSLVLDCFDDRDVKEREACSAKYAEANKSAFDRIRAVMDLEQAYHLRKYFGVNSVGLHWLEESQTGPPAVKGSSKPKSHKPANHHPELKSQRWIEDVLFPMFSDPDSEGIWAARNAVVAMGPALIPHLERRIAVTNSPKSFGLFDALDLVQTACIHQPSDSLLGTRTVALRAYESKLNLRPEQLESLKRGLRAALSAYDASRHEARERFGFCSMTRWAESPKETETWGAVKLALLAPLDSEQTTTFHNSFDFSRDHLLCPPGRPPLDWRLRSLMGRRYI